MHLKFKYNINSNIVKILYYSSNWKILIIYSYSTTKIKNTYILWEIQLLSLWILCLSFYYHIFYKYYYHTVTEYLPWSVDPDIQFTPYTTIENGWRTAMFLLGE